MRRQLTEPFPYLILDARYEKVRIDHVIRDQAVLVAIGMDGTDGGRFGDRDGAPRERSELDGVPEKA